LGVVLVVHEHERVAVAVGEARLPARELDLAQLVVGVEAGVDPASARHAVHAEAEAHVAAAALGRAALDVADLVGGALVLDDAALPDVGGFHSRLTSAPGGPRRPGGWSRR